MTHFPNALDVRPFGIDVSRFNSVDWVTVAGFAAPKVRYAMVRSGQAFQGAYDDIDRRLFYNWHNARATLGAENVMPYHVFYPGSAVLAQVENVQRIGRLLGGFGPGPFWIDLELNQSLTGAPIIDRAWDFIRGLRDMMGIEVGIYTGKWFIDKFKLPIRSWWAEIPWWMAQYGNGTRESGPLVIPNGIPPARVLFHQTTSSLEGSLLGAPLGVRVDGNRALGG